jgi:probable DNA repair protein
VPEPFVQLSPELLDACRHGTVLTPNDRLRRELVRAYDAWMAVAGHRAWPSVDAFSLDGWFGHTYRLSRAVDPGLPRLLDPTAELLLWQATAPEGQGALAALARDAWALAWYWEAPLDDHSLGRTENSRLFSVWCRRFVRARDDRRAVTGAELPTVLRERGCRGPARLACFAFESTATAIGRYLNALEDLGTELIRLDDPGREAQRIWRVELADRRAEIGAAAQWCRQILLNQPDARIGVVVPDLAQRHAAVERQFAAYLEPVGSSGESRAFDLAGGQALADQPIWREAERWLRFCFTGLPVPEVRRLLASHYLTVPALGRLPAELPETFSLQDVATVGRDPVWHRLAQRCPNGTELRPFPAWLDRFATVLTEAGWDGRGTGSVQFQAYRQSRELLHEATCAGTFPGACNAATALTAIGRLARQRLFAPQRAAAPIQVLGYLETTGLRFTHLWVSGLQDVRWPAPAHVNPLIPLSLQRSCGVPRIDPAGELAFAERRLEHWQRSAGTLVLSHGREEDGTRHDPSALIGALPATPPQQLIPELLAASHPAFQRSGASLVGDSQESATPSGPAAVGGGSGLLRDQALCPFRRWAVHRLDLGRPMEPHGFPDARDRGALVHEVLHQALARDAAAPAHPSELDMTRLDELLARIVASQYQRFPAPVRETERQRLRTLLCRWLEVEAARAPFTVAALEHEVALTLDGLTLRLRFDRVDRVGGAAVVLDYKTGRTQPQRLFDARLSEPQLPLYALADESIRGVLFVELGDDGVFCKGVAAESVALEPARLTPLREPWDAVRAGWSEQLTALAAEIRQGRAEVAPVGPEACRSCHLQAFCRIHEHAAAGADADTDGAAAAL